MLMLARLPLRLVRYMSSDGGGAWGLWVSGMPFTQCAHNAHAMRAHCTCFVWGSISAPGTHRAGAGHLFFLPFPTRACFCPHLTKQSGAPFRRI